MAEPVRGGVEGDAVRSGRFRAPVIVGDAKPSNTELTWSRDDNGTKIRRLEEGESGALYGRLSEERYEAIAEWIALPKRARGKGDVPGTVVELAARLGVSPALVRRAARSRRVLDRVADLHKVAAAHMMGDVLMGQFEKHQRDQDVKSAYFIRDVASLGHTTPQLLNYVNIQSTSQNLYLSSEQIASDDDHVVTKAKALLERLGIARKVAVEREALVVEAEDAGGAHNPS